MDSGVRAPRLEVIVGDHGTGGAVSEKAATRALHGVAQELRVSAVEQVYGAAQSTLEPVALDPDREHAVEAERGFGPRPGHHVIGHHEIRTARGGDPACVTPLRSRRGRQHGVPLHARAVHAHQLDRKSTRLNSSHGYISYAVFCLKKKNIP